MTVIALFLVAQSAQNVKAHLDLDWAGRGDLLATVEGPDRGGPAWRFDPSKVEMRVQGSNPKPRFAPLWEVGHIYDLPTDASQSFRWIGKLGFDRSSAFPGWYSASVFIDKAVIGLSGKSVKSSSPFRFYLPKDTNDETARLRKKWVGKKVWVMGASAFVGPSNTEIWDPRLPATILDIKRDEAVWEPTGLLPLWQFGDGWGPIPTVCFHPLTVSLRLPKIVIHHVSDGIADDGPVYDVPFTDSERKKNDPLLKTPPSGQVGLLKVADEWQIQRMLSASSPETLFMGLDPSVEAEFAKRKVKPDMTREMVARLLGYPSNWEMVADLNRKPIWQYQGPGSFAYKVLFSSDGYVTSAKWVGSMP